jgi:hypothetical protein
MDLYDIRQLWSKYQNELANAEKRLQALYGIPIILMGRSVEYVLLGAVVGILLLIVGVQL